MIPSDLSRSSRVRSGLAFAASCVLFLTVASCQTADSSGDANPTQVQANIELKDEWKAPDAVTWRISGGSKPGQLSGSGKYFVATIELPTPLKAGDSIIVQMWTAGMRSAEIKYLQVAGNPVLNLTESVRLDAVAMALLERLPQATQRNTDTLLAAYARALVDAGTDNAVFEGFPKNCPTGIDQSKLVDVALAYAVSKKTKLEDLSKTWLLAIDEVDVHARVLALVQKGVVQGADTSAMFPPPPVRVRQVLAVASDLKAGGSSVAISGAFEWDAGLGLIALNSYAICGNDTLKSVAVTGVPGIGPDDPSVTLTGNAQILAGADTKPGVCSLVVVVRDGGKNSARSAAKMTILGADTSTTQNPTQVMARFAISDPWKAPDRATWRVAPADTQAAFLGGSGLDYRANISLAAPLGDRDTLTLQLWTAGMRTAQLSYVQVAGSAELTLVGSKLDTVAMALLQKLPLASQRNSDTLLAVYAKALVDGNPAFKGYPANRPAGIDSAKLAKAALTYAVSGNTTLDDLSKTWLLTIDAATAQKGIRELVKAGVVAASDTLGVLAAPYLRVKTPISVASSLTAGDAAASIAGAFEWTKGVGAVALKANVLQGKDTVSSVFAVTGLPTGSNDLSVSLANAKIMALSGAKAGLCSLIVVATGANLQARSAVQFEVKAANITPQTPKITLMSPVEGKQYAFDTTTILVRWAASAVGSTIDTLLVNDVLAEKDGDSTWKAWVSLMPTGKATLVVARARNKAGQWASQSANFVREADLVGPVITWLSPVADTSVESSITKLTVTFKAQDPSGLDTVLVNGVSVDSIVNGVYFKTVALGSEGASTPVVLRVVDKAKNPSTSTRSVMRKTDNSLAIYGLPDSVGVLEDSSATLVFRPNCPAGTTCKLQTSSADAGLAQASIVGDTSVRIVGQSNRNGSTTVSVEIVSGSKKTSVSVKVGLLPVNDAPTLSVNSPLSGSPNGALQFSNWLASVSAGPSDESSQKIGYAVTVDSAAVLINGTPSIDANGKLNLTPKGISGTARLSIVATDNGDGTGANKNKSAPQAIRVRLDAPPAIQVNDTLVGYEDQRTKADTVRIEDLESPNDLVLDWTSLDETLLPSSGMRVKSVAGGYSFDFLPAQNLSGVGRVALRLKDASGNESKDTLYVKILPVNDAPVIAKASGLPDTLVIQCTSSDTSTPKLYGNIQWEPGTSTQTGTVDIQLADPSQSHLFYYSWNIDGIEVLTNGGIRMQLKYDTSIVVQVLVRATDDGGTSNGGVNTVTRSVWIKLTNTLKDVDGNSYTYRRMPDNNHWMEQNLRTKPRNGDDELICGGPLYGITQGCQDNGRIYTWQQAMNVDPSCLDEVCIGKVQTPAQGLCPDGWHVASAEDWNGLFRSTMSSGSADSAYNLRSADTTWSNYFESSSPMRYPGSGKYGKFIVPMWDVWEEVRYKGETGGVIFWMPTFASDYSGDFASPPALKLVDVTDNTYNGVTVSRGALRCTR